MTWTDVASAPYVSNKDRFLQWLKTDLGGQGADLEVPVGVEAVVKIILESGPEQNGESKAI